MVNAKYQQHNEDIKECIEISKYYEETKSIIN